MRTALFTVALAAWGCAPADGGGAPDAAPVDLRPAADQGAQDARPADAQPTDAQPMDRGAEDAQPGDALPTDAGVRDAEPDAMVPDAQPDATVVPDAAPDAAPLECVVDRDCDDGVFCTGLERCAAGACVVDPVDCAAEQPACALASRCDAATDRCEDVLPDGDGDGQPGAACLDRYGQGGPDCDDDDAARGDGQREICDGRDNDCDGEVDEAYAAELDPAARLPWPAAAADASGWRLGPTVDGRAIVSWAISGPGRFNEDGFVAVVDAADGSPVGAPAVTVAAGAYPADLVRLGDGFAAFWMDQTNFGRTLRARRVSPAGVAGAPVEIHRPLNSTQPGDRTFVSDAAGQRAVALWVEQDDSGLRTRYRLQARVVDAQLQPLTDVLVLSDTTAQFRPYTPTATWQGDQVVVAWLGGFELFARTIGRGGVLAPPEPVQLADLLGAGRGKVRLVSTPAGARGLLTSEGNWRLFGVGDDASLTLPLTRIRPDAGPYLAGLCALPDGLLVAGDGPDGAAWLAGFGFDGQPKGEEPTLAGGPDDPRALVDLVCDRPALVWRPPEGPPALDVAPIVERCGPRCDDPRFAGPDCDRCADPRFAGPECDVCAAGFRGAGCALCVSPELEGELCDQCRDARYVAPDCVQCADEARAGDQCDRQRLLSIDCGQSVSLGRKAPLGTVAKWGSGGHGTEVLQAWDLAVAGSRSNNYCLGRADRFACFGSTALRITANEPAPPVRDADIGDTCACAVRADASLYCWGTDPGGVFQVPPGAFTQVAVGWTHACAVSAAGAVVCWGDDAHGQASPPPLAAVQRVAAGETFTCALHGEGEGQVTCWGDAADGRTAPPPGPHVALAVGRDFACAIDAASALACWGAMPNGEAQVPAGAFTQLSAGDGFACALDETGAAVCWGRRGEFSQPP